MRLSRRNVVPCAALLGVGIATSVALHGCKTPTSQKSDVLTNDSNYAAPTVDVNDLSYMFPRNSAGQIYPLIKVSQTWAAHLATYNRTVPATVSILRQPIYANVLAATTNPANFIPKNPPSGFVPTPIPFAANDTTGFEYQNMIVTSFRIDPCAQSLALDAARTNFQGNGNPLGAASKGIVTQINGEITRLGLGFSLNNCQTQIRLIVQPVSTDFKTVGESTIHMVYTLNFGQLAPMLKVFQDAVLELKRDLNETTGIDTTGLMLQPHPGLQYEALQNSNNSQYGPGAQKVLNFLEAMLGRFPDPQVMAIIRSTAVNGKQVDVVLGGGTSNGAYAPAPLVSSNLAKGFIMTSSPTRGDWDVTPAPEFNNPMINLFNLKNTAAITSPSNVNLQTLMIADDPESTHFFVNDCITCHGSSQIIKEMGNKQLAAGAPSRYKIPAGVSGFPIGSYLPDSPAKEGGVILRNFGYSRNRPIIGLRTVTETAALADYFNRDMRGLQNPGADCSAVEANIWQATMNLAIDNPNNAQAYKIDLAKYRNKVQGQNFAPEDSLFASCKTAVQNANVGVRGDGTNTAQIGEVMSPFLSAVSYTGVDSSGRAIALTLSNGIKGKQADYFTNGVGTSKGTWELDANNRIQTKGTNMNFVLAMNGAQLTPASTAPFTKLGLGIAGQASQANASTSSPQTSASTSCSSPGVPALGACWYVALAPTDCAQICSKNGKAYDEQTRTIAGSGGTLTNCNAIRSAFGIPSGTDTTCNSGLSGCFYLSSQQSARCTTPDTVPNGNYPSYQRFCACN